MITITSRHKYHHQPQGKVKAKCGHEYTDVHVWVTNGVLYMNLKGTVIAFVGDDIGVFVGLINRGAIDAINQMVSIDKELKGQSDDS